jgi:2'-5' RNA ligase
MSGSTDVGVGRSAVIVPIELLPPLERARLAGDPVAVLGVPAHITLLFPFLEPRLLGSDVLGRLAGVIGREPAFDVELASVAAFPASGDSAGVVYLPPDPAEPFVRLTRAIWAEWPDHPPYEGAFDEVIPHLTIAEGSSRLAEVEAVARAALPLRQRVEEAWVIVEGADGRWRRLARLALGPRTPPRAVGSC